MSIRDYIASAVLRQVLAHPCGVRIRRSGKNGAAVNCFVTAIDKGDEPYLIVESLSQGQLACIEWDGSAYKNPIEIPLHSFRLKDFRISHYYGLSEINYDGVVDYLINRATSWPYTKIHVARFFTGADQYFFNKRKLITKQRKDLLKVLVTEALEGNSEQEQLDLMTALYSIKWFSHPQGKEAHRRLAFYLDSLVESGELKKLNHKYVVTGEALRAIEDYEEQERKHAEGVKMQRRTFWLTVAVAALTSIQAGLVTLPPILDFTSTQVAK